MLQKLFVARKGSNVESSAKVQSLNQEAVLLIRKAARILTLFM